MATLKSTTCSGDMTVKGDLSASSISVSGIYGIRLKNNKIEIGGSAVTGSIAIGSGSTANHTSSVSIGYNAKSSGSSSVSIGSNANNRGFLSDIAIDSNGMGFFSNYKTSVYTTGSGSSTGIMLPNICSGIIMVTATGSTQPTAGVYAFTKSSSTFKVQNISNSGVKTAITYNSTGGITITSSSTTTYAVSAWFDRVV